MKKGSTHFKAIRITSSTTVTGKHMLELFINKTRKEKTKDH